MSGRDGGSWGQRGGMGLTGRPIHSELLYQLLPRQQPCIVTGSQQYKQSQCTL